MANQVFITTGMTINAELLEKKHVLLIESDMQLLDENYDSAYFKKILELLSEEI